MPSHDDSGKTDAEQYIDQLDRELQPGDVAYDKNSGSWLYVVEVVAETVEAYDEQDGGRDLLTYAGNQLTNCTLQDRVVGAVHLNKNTTKSAGKGRGDSGVYDYPVGRLTRFVPETADDDLKRVQDTLRLHALSELLQAAMSLDDDEQGAVRRAVTEAFGQEVKMDAQSLAQVEVGDKWGADLPEDDAEDGDDA